MDKKLMRRPGICTALNVLGLLCLIGAVVMFLMGVFAFSSMGMGAPKVGGNLLAMGLASGIGGTLIGYAFEAIISGVLLLAASKIVELLATIRVATLTMMENGN
jgi:hypothetical protein